MYGECRHSLSWTSRAIKTYFSFKVISFIPGNKLSNSVKAFLVLYIIWLLFFYKNIGFRRFRGLLIRSSVTPTSARRNHEPRWRRKTYSAAHFKDKSPTTRKRKCLRSNKIFSLLRDVKITKAQSITTHISNTQLYHIAFIRQLGTRPLYNNGRVKFFCRKFFEKISSSYHEEGKTKQQQSSPLLSQTSIRK